MSNVKILVWQNREGTGDPDVEVLVPTKLAKWVPRMMKFMPKKTKEETWGSDVDFEEVFGNIEKLIEEAVQSGQNELMDVKTKDSHIKILVET